MKAIVKPTTIYGKTTEYTTNGTYTFNIENGGLYNIELIGAGGGSAYTDGSTDSYSDTAWAQHYGKSGGNGAIFEGVARLSKGTLSITVGKVGANLAGKGNTAGDGGDSYIIFTPANGEPVEIVRAGGGKSGYPSGDTYQIDVEGGNVTYNSDYIVKIMQNTKGKNGTLKWSVHR